MKMSAAIVQINDSTARLLEELAEKTGLTTSDVLDKALDAYKRKVFLEQVNAAYAVLRADPTAWADVEAERQSMAGSLMDGLDPKECWGENGTLQGL
jgi:hypothetical protein